MIIRSPDRIGTSIANTANFRTSSPRRIAAYSCPFCLQHAALHEPQGLAPRMAKRRLRIGVLSNS